MTVARVQRVMPAPPDAVYDEWLDPDALRDWMCPRPARPIAIELDPTVGGAVRIDIEEDGVEFFVVGHYVELDRPNRLAFTWSCSTWEDPTHQSVVTVTFEPSGEQETLMTIEHELLPADLVARHEAGWVQIAAQLAAALSRQG